MNKHVSRLIQATKGFDANLNSYAQPPGGMFGRVAIVRTGSVVLNSENIDIEFNVPFDDSDESNECELIAYNLSNTTIQNIRYNAPITIQAGYKSDTGVIFAGYISKVSTKTQGLDKITTIKAIDDGDLQERTIVETAYKAGTKASYILQDLVSRVNLPVAVFRIRRDHTYKDKTKVDGGLMENIRKYAEVCGVSVYVNNGKLYIRHISEGDSIGYIVSANTGLISVEEFEEEQTAEDYKSITRGYKLEMILQHRITTAAIINLSAQNAAGQFRVRSGEHIFNPDEAITKCEVII